MATAGARTKRSPRPGPGERNLAIMAVSAVPFQTAPGAASPTMPPGASPRHEPEPMITHHDIRLALPGDADAIALMSRDLVEFGLGWRWTPGRILASIRDGATNVAVATAAEGLTGFGIMSYSEEEAHLLLLAVAASHRRRGIGSALLSWLEAAALTAGIGLVRLEARCTNGAALAFYRRLGYKEIEVIRGYYRGREDCVWMAKDLWQVP